MGWDQVAVVQDEQPWLVFVRVNEGTVWLTVKVVADGDAPTKANYWLGWNGKQFARHADVAKLLHRPVLLAAVEQALRTYSQQRGLVGKQG